MPLNPSLTQRDRFLTGLQAKLHDAFASCHRQVVLDYKERPGNHELNAVNLWTVLSRLTPRQGWLMPPSGLSAFKEQFRHKGNIRIYSASESALAGSIEALMEEDIGTLVLWRLFPTQRERAVQLIAEKMPTMNVVTVLDPQLNPVPASDTRTVLPKNRVSPEKAARMRALLPYTLLHPFEGGETQEIPEIVDASASRAHCRLCGTVIQPKTSCVRYVEFPAGAPRHVRRPQPCYLHSFDCTQPEQVLFIDTLKGYAVVTNDHGLPTEVKLLGVKYDAEKSTITYKTLDIQAPID